MTLQTLVGGHGVGSSAAVEETYQTFVKGSAQPNNGCILGL